MKRKLTDEFLNDLAINRAKELFTKEFFSTCTDSWWGDEFFEFKAKKVKFEGKFVKPTENDADKYMGYMQKYKNYYYDNFYSSINAMAQYHAIIDYISKILDCIEEGHEKYSAFKCDNDTINNIKKIGNYFVDLYNTELKEFKSKHKDELENDND